MAGGKGKADIKTLLIIAGVLGTMAAIGTMFALGVFGPVPARDGQVRVMMPPAASAPKGQ
ncbi:MAG: hypothetical protein ABW199_04080 [Caulobacterales bacterium]